MSLLIDIDKMKRGHEVYCGLYLRELICRMDMKVIQNFHLTFSLAFESSPQNPGVEK